MNWSYMVDKILSLDNDGKIISEVDFVKKDVSTIDIKRVYVNPEFRGQGVADKTMLTVVDYLRNYKLKAIPTCSYANSWFHKNEDKYKDLIASDIES